MLVNGNRTINQTNSSKRTFKHIATSRKLFPAIKSEEKL